MSLKRAPCSTGLAFAFAYEWALKAVARWAIALPYFVPELGEVGQVKPLRVEVVEVEEDRPSLGVAAEVVAVVEAWWILWYTRSMSTMTVLLGWY
jgi:hypothetical protein